MTTGEKLRMSRGDRKRKDVAKALNISVSALTMYESDKRRPRDDLKMAMADYFGKSVSYLFFEH